MKINAVPVCLAATIAFVQVCASPATAQVSSDGTLSTTVNSSDNRNFVIENGDRAGGNLFHSFREFSVPTGGSAYFNNAADVQNIFTRVTGGSVSNIDGLIRANGSANLFLLNPSGILFGANARLNIGGSFVGTTASAIKFSDGTEFSATNATSPPLLTMSVPIGLQMGNSPGTITVQGTGHQLTQPSFFSPILPLSPVTGLGVTSGNTFALIGGAIALKGGVLTAPSGHIELGSVSSGTVSLNTTTPQWQFEYGNISQFADVRLSQQALIDASGAPAGSLQIRGRNISFLEGSVARLQNLGGTALGDLAIHASGLLEMRQVGTSGFQNNLLSSENLGTGAGSNLSVSAQQLDVQDGGVITTKAFSAGAGGNLSIQVADTLLLDGWSRPDPTVVTSIGASTLAAGKGGDVTLSSRQLRLSNGANILNLTAGTGLSGNIAVTAADWVEVSGETPPILRPSALGNTTINQGNGGNLSLTAPMVIVRAGAIIGTSTLSPGNGGNLTINASDRIEVSGIGLASGQPSRIAARAELLPEVLRQAYGLPAFPEGDAGNLTMNTPLLQVSDRALVGVDHQGVGNAGDLRLNANTVLLDRGSITASTRSGGGGNMNLHTNALTLRHGSNVIATASGAGNGGQIAIATDTLDLLGNSRIGTQAQGSGNAGTLNLRVDQLTLNHGQIGVESQGSGNAGRLTIDADSAQLSDRSLINASTQVGQGGDIQLQVRDTLRLNDHSRILANARQSGREGQGGAGNLTVSANQIYLNDRSALEAEVAGGDRGNIALNSDFLSLRRGSRITTNATGQASGGNIALNTEFVVGLENSDIVARAQQGTGGNIAIATHGLIGIAPRAELTPESDINASSQLGLNGTVNVTTPNVNPESGLVKLPEEVVDASQQIAQTCAATQASRFVATGRGGIPENPTQALSSDRAWNDIRDLSAYLGTAIAPASLTVQSPILEATGFTVNSQGQVELVATSESSRPSNPAPATCSSPSVQ